jgi:DNA-binding transcriptional LysR family regulator
MDLKLKQLKVFLTVAETLHFGKAAQQLYMSQPALTFQIQSIESAIGIQLLNRGRRHVELTDAGKGFVKTANRIISEMRQFKESLDSLSTEEPLRVVCAPSGEHVILPAVIRRLKEISPSCRVDLCSLHPIDYQRALQDNRVDVLLMVRHMETPGIAFQLITKQQMYAVVPEGSYYAERGSISLEAFGQQPIIVTSLQQDDETQPLIERMLEPYGITPNFINAPGRQSARVALVAAGMGVTLANEWRLSERFPGVKMIPFEESLEPMKLGAAWRTSFESPMLTNFKSALQDVIFELSQQKKPSLAVPISKIRMENMVPKAVLQANQAPRHRLST